MPIENGACSFIDDERFGETAPPFCHIEKLIPVSRLDFFTTRSSADDRDARDAFARATPRATRAFELLRESRRAIAAEAREKFLWRPFAAATAEDVPTCSDGDGDAPPELREDETP